MKDYKDTKVAININNPLKKVKHNDLKRYNTNSVFKSVCPVCNDGLLLIHRLKETFVLSEYDACILCGQRYQYIDINELRKKDFI